MLCGCGSKPMVGAPPILVYFRGDWDVHWGYRLLILTHGHACGKHLVPFCFPPFVSVAPLLPEAAAAVGGGRVPKGPPGPGGGAALPGGARGFAVSRFRSRGGEGKSLLLDGTWKVETFTNKPFASKRDQSCNQFSSKRGHPGWPNFLDSAL